MYYGMHAFVYIKLINVMNQAQKCFILKYFLFILPMLARVSSTLPFDTLRPLRFFSYFLLEVSDKIAFLQSQQRCRTDFQSRVGNLRFASIRIFLVMTKVSVVFFRCGRELSQVNFNLLFPIVKSLIITMYAINVCNFKIT